jgi:3-deoxy-D-manno-octulosonic acid (KDO) 8-phosphate synthase
MPIFDYADFVWGDKNYSVLMNNLQVLHNKAANIILDAHHSRQPQNLYDR